MSIKVSNKSLSWIGRGSDDFPFYSARAQQLSVWQWLCLMGLVALGFSLLLLPLPIFTTNLGQFFQVLLFSVIPLAGLYLMAEQHKVNLFGRLRRIDFGLMIGFALLNLLITISLSLLLSNILDYAANETIAAVTKLSRFDTVLFFLRSGIQIFGEEVLTILPFLAVLWLAVSCLGVSRNKAIVVAWLVSSLIFALAHLSTYDWNILQCVLIIGTARLILLLPYIITKNIWVSTGAHILNDYIIFSLTILGAARASL